MTSSTLNSTEPLAHGEAPYWRLLEQRARSAALCSSAAALWRGARRKLSHVTTMHVAHALAGHDGARTFPSHADPDISLTFFFFSVSVSQAV